MEKNARKIKPAKHLILFIPLRRLIINWYVSVECIFFLSLGFLFRSLCISRALIFFRAHCICYALCSLLLQQHRKKYTHHNFSLFWLFQSAGEVHECKWNGKPVPTEQRIGKMEKKNTQIKIAIIYFVICVCTQYFHFATFFSVLFGVHKMKWKCDRYVSY